MKRSTLQRVCCPVCRGFLRLGATFDPPGSDEVLEAVLCCQTCRRWFRVERGIADLVRDELREDAEERAFLARHREQLTGEILEQGRPVSLAGPPLARSEADARIVEEGRHWGAFMRRFWDAGDRSIFDLSIRGQHPRFLVAGILERDERDKRRRHGFFPTRAGAVLFDGAGFRAGEFGLDLGCGGGQFALAYAMRGLEVLGIDPSFEELAMARDHARARGVANIDYVRAEPASPPVAPGSGDVLLAQDALHHVPELARVLRERIAPLLRPGARAFIHEHVGKSPAKRRILGAIGPPLIAKMRRRYPRCEVPPELLRDSANEDVSMEAVRPAVLDLFESEDEYAGMWLYLDVEALVWYAFGKRAWFASLAKGAAWALEHTLLCGEPREFWSFRGRLKPPRDSRDGS